MGLICAEDTASCGLLAVEHKFAVVIQKNIAALLIFVCRAELNFCPFLA
jgi:hypothetical protein